MLEAAKAPQRLIVTPILIGLNVAVFVAMVASGVSLTSPDIGALMKFGANNGVAVVVNHEWWRPFTAMFVHVGGLHLLVNMYSLWQVGAFVERLLGRTMLAAVYVLTGLAASFASIMWNPIGISAGASGAIFGLFGIITGFTIRARHALPPTTLSALRSSIVTTLGFNLLFVATMPFLDHAAHAGGFAAGVLAGVVATSSALESDLKRPRWSSLLVVLATVVGLAVLADTRTKNLPKTAARLMKLQTAMVQGNFDEAVPLQREYLETDPMNGMMMNNLAWSLVLTGGDLDEAMRLADEAVRREPEYAVFGTRCWVHQARGETAQAKTDCEIAVKKAGDGTDPVDEGMLAFLNGNKEKAVERWTKAISDEPYYARYFEKYLAQAR